MEQGPHNYRPGHYAAQNREMGAAISKYASEVTKEQFEAMLNLYDRDRCLQLPSDIPEPVEMIRKLEEKITRKKKKKTTQEEKTGAQRACCDFLNSLIGLLPTKRVEFIDRSSVAPMDHIAGTTCRPRLLAISAGSPSNQAPRSPGVPWGGPVQAPQSPDIRESQSSYESQVTQSYRLDSSDSSDSSGSSGPPQAVSWVEMETVVEFYSTGTTTRKGTKQGVAYTSYLLQQRPDRVAVLGLYISKRDFSLILMDATDVYYTTLQWEKDLARNLLLRVLYYINDPPVSMMDPTIIRKKNDTFTIKVADEDYEDCTLMSCGHPIGRRTVVFLSGKPSAPVIKEQYLRCATGAEISEMSMLEAVHKDGEMPGVVRVHWSGYVERADGSSIECGTDRWRRRKVRAVLRDQGALFMTIPTPYDALVTAWDALEVTRCLFRERGVLHRDISKGNVLFRKSRTPSTTTPKTLGFCTVLHLLGDSHLVDDTPALITDFDHAEIKDKNDESKDEGNEGKNRQTVGTPIFMARSVVAGRPLLPMRWICLSDLPRLSALALPVYVELLPERLKKFPQPQENQEERLATITKETREKLWSLPWSHELRHDGESVFWLLVWWAIHLRPKSPPSSKIDSTIFAYLTSIDLAKRRDGRMAFIQELAEARSWLDPAYQELEPLFLQMATQLTGDLYWAEYGGTVEMKDPKFLHEALQRIIFNFLMENQMKPFMRLEKDPLHDREVEDQIPRRSEKQFTPPSTSTKRSRSPMAGQSESEGSRKRIRLTKGSGGR